MRFTQPINNNINQSIDQPTTTTNRPIDQSIDQPIDYSIHVQTDSRLIQSNTSTHSMASDKRHTTTHSNQRTCDCVAPMTSLLRWANLCTYACISDTIDTQLTTLKLTYEPLTICSCKRVRESCLHPLLASRSINQPIYQSLNHFNIPSIN